MTKFKKKAMIIHLQRKYPVILTNAISPRKRKKEYEAHGFH
jgi:hypothetical protein